MDPQIVENTPKINDRDFLKIAGITGITLLAASLGIFAWDRERKEREFGSKVAVLDVFGVSTKDTIDLTGDIELLANNSFEKEYGGHGEKVLEMINKLQFNQIEPQEKISLAGTVKIEEIGQDLIGNTVVNIEISEKDVAKLINQTEAGTINMSFEVGKFPLTIVSKREKLKNPSASFPNKTQVGDVVTYHDDSGKRITQKKYEEMEAFANEKIIIDVPKNEQEAVFMDGYAGENTYENLLSMTNIAAKYPEKTFVVAGGNPKYLNGLKIPDIREARAKFERHDMWPDNLIVVGYQYNGDGMIAPACYGADIYVKDNDLEKMGFQAASSFATPVITEIVSALKKRGIKKWKDVLLNKMTNINEFWVNDKKLEYKVLDLDTVKELLR